MAIDVELFYDAINNIAKQQVQANPGDLTIDATITKLFNAELGEYKVEYQGNIFSAFSVDPTITYFQDERVYVLVPRGDFSTKKMILCRASHDDNLSYQDKQDMTNFYVEQGPNWVSGEEGTYRMDYSLDGSGDECLQICVVPVESKVNLNVEKANYEHQGFRRWSPEDERIPREFATKYPATYMEKEELQNVDQLFQNYGQDYNAIKIQASFRTAFLNTHDKGQYYLQVIFITKNPRFIPEGEPGHTLYKDEKEFILVPYKLEFHNFNGSPYEYPVPTPQKAYFDVSPGDLAGIHSVSLMQDGNFVCDFLPTYNEQGELVLRPQDAILNQNNIFCSDVEVRFCQKINLLDSLYYCWIEQPYGNAVYDKTEEVLGRDAVYLWPHFLYTSQEVTKDCKIMWFREDLGVTNETPKLEDWPVDEDLRDWTYYTGPGWRPITHFIDNRNEGNGAPGDGEEGGQPAWSNDYEIGSENQLKISKSAVKWRWRYKLVCVYRDKGVFGSATTEIVNLNSPYDLYIEPITSKDSHKAMLRINDKKHQVGKDIDPSVKKLYPEWFGDWYYQLPDNAYLAIEPKYMHGPIDITDFGNYEHVLFRAACYDPKEVCPPNGEFQDYVSTPITSAEPIGYVEYEAMSSDDIDILLTWEGEPKSFNYTASGQLYADEDSSIEHTIAVKINQVHGDLTLWHIQLVAPDGVELYERSKYNTQVNEDGTESDSGGNNGYSPACSMMYDMYQDYYGVFHFKVRQEYDPLRSLNTITARVRNQKTNVYYESECVIQFTKDGQQGTQGTVWAAPILPTNNLPMRKMTVENGKSVIKEDSAPFSLRLGYQTCPLIIRRKMENGKEVFYQDTDQNRIFLRPFVTKEGKAIESLTESGGDHRDYRYKVYWDVRYPQHIFDPKLKGASFLRICDPLTGTPLGVDSSHKKGTYNPPNANGLTALTSWDGSIGNVANSTYAAVEIRYAPEAEIGIKHEDTRFNFYVKATIDVESRLPSTAIKRKMVDGKVGDYVPEVKNEGTWHRIKTLVAWYPIDVFIYDQENDDIKFNLRNLYVNWPREIPYSSTGYDPAIIDQFLEFYYDFDPEMQDKSQGYAIIPSDEATRMIQTINKQNLTPVEMDEYSKFLNMSKEQQSSYVTTLPPEDYRYKLKPKSNLNWQEGSVGTIIGRLPRNEERKIPGGIFIRNQIYYTNRYGNVDINGWDGQGIDINEEDGTIFAPTIGAGFKGPLTNTFTGVLMGVNSEFKRQTDGIVQYTDVEQEELEQYPLMTGLFGYQCGVASFGLLENGTAFFGRADRGGRIIIDGYNATIYGGANGQLNSPGIGDPMWNSMRLSMVDLTHQSTGILPDGSYPPVTQEGEDSEKVNPKDYTDGKYDSSSVENWQKSTPSSSAKDPKKPVTTSVQGILQGYGGASFGGVQDGKHDNYGVCSQLPWWYGYIWQNAYIKGQNTLPWWFDYKKKQEPDETVLPPYNAAIDGSYRHDLPNYKINYWQPTLTDIRRYCGIEDGQECGPISGFGPSRASTTPAIEIGQHPPGLMPGLIPWGKTKEVFRNLWIPGNRNFMVTYDGTLWAMNGVFMGNVIGSNIIGGRIQGVELGIGDPEEIDFSKIRVIDQLDDWNRLTPPTTKPLDQDKIDEITGSTSIDPNGSMVVSDITIYGGKLDMGSFHIIGDDTLDKYGNSAYGHLVQFGHSDFVGATHFYGNIGIGPDESNHADKTGADNGNLFQTNGIAALGILYQTQEFVWHNYFAGDKGKMNDSMSYKYSRIPAPGDPGILNMRYGSESIEQAAMFAVNTRTKEKIENVGEGYVGHFWPMSYRYVNAKIAPDQDDKDPTLYGVHAYMTTMDIFKSRPFEVDSNLFASKLPVDGGNYFRVGPWGYEFIRGYICQRWQPEDKSAAPTVDRKDDDTGSDGFPGGVRGMIGLVNRGGGGGATSQAIGMDSWGKAPIIMSSDENFMLKTKNWMSLRALASNTQMAKANGTNVIGLGGEHSDPGEYGYSCELSMGNVLSGDGTGGFSPNAALYVMQTEGMNKGWLLLGVTNVLKKDAPGHTFPPYPLSGNSQQGILMLPESAKAIAAYQQGMYIFSNKSDIHIVRCVDDQPKDCHQVGNEVTEALFQQDQITLYAKRRIIIGWGGGQCAHTEDGKWKHAAFFEGEGIQIINNDESQSIGDTGSGGGSNTPPTPAKPGDKKYCIYFGTTDNKSGNSEISWQPNLLSIAGNQVWISGGNAGTPHNPGNFMLFAQNSIDMKGAYAIPENQFHIYARFA